MRLPQSKAPLTLLTSSLADSPTAWLRIVIAYLKRWGVEKGVRLVKQIFDLENVRALSFAGIQRLTLFACLWFPVFVCEAGGKTYASRFTWFLQELREDATFSLLSVGKRVCGGAHTSGAIGD